MSTEATPLTAEEEAEAVRDALFNLPHGARCIWQRGEEGCSCSKQRGYAALARLLATLTRERAEHAALREAAERIPGPEMEEYGSIDWRSWALSVRAALE